MIHVADISYQVRDRYLLRDISFEIYPGQLVVILGSNGAGKSTLLKILSSELKPAPGFIRLENKNLNHWPSQELATFRAVLPQHTLLSLPFSVADVVMMGRYPHFKNNPSPLDHTIVRNALKRAGVVHLSDRNYLTLSGGERQRVHLARIFAQVWYNEQHPVRYLFMDEPLNNLDIRHQHTTLQLARQFAKEGNVVVAVLHDLNLAMQYADKVLMLCRGEQVCYGDTRDVLNNETISHVYDFPMHVLEHSAHLHPVIIPAYQ